MNMNTQSVQRMNGSNGANLAQGEGPVQINPVEVAQLALMFLSRSDLKPSERPAFGHVELLLQAIASGQVQLTSSEPETQAPLPLDLPPQ